MCFLEYMEVTTEESIAGAFAVTNKYDSYGVALAGRLQRVRQVGLWPQKQDVHRAEDC